MEPNLFYTTYPNRNKYNDLKYDYDMIMILFILPSLRTVTKFRKDRMVSSLYC